MARARSNQRVSVARANAPRSPFNGEQCPPTPPGGRRDIRFMHDEHHRIALDGDRSALAQAIAAVSLGRLVPPVYLPDGEILRVDGTITADPTDPFQIALREFE